MSLDATLGGDAANSFVTVDEADTYFSNHFSTAKNTLWSGLTSAQKESVLKRACQQLETLRVLDYELGYGALPLSLLERGYADYTIHRLYPHQLLSFPRNIDLDATSSAYIPQAVKDAQCEQAVYMVAYDDSILQARLNGVADETVSAGPVRIHTTYRAGGGISLIGPMTLELMRPFLRPTNRIQRA